jgi:hypothetical protein
MRILFAGFGLLSVLITVAIMLYMSANEASVTIPAGIQARAEVSQFAGVDQNGNRVEDSYTLDPQTRAADGRLKCLVVSRLDPQSPLKSFFGLQKGDQIITSIYQAVNFNVSDEADAEDAELKVREAYVHSGQLIVMRGGQQITLPDATTKANQNNSAAQGANPQQPQGQQQQSSSPPESDPMKTIENQLHSLPGN